MSSMADDILNLGNTMKMVLPDNVITKPKFIRDLRLDGFNEDFTKIYYWHLHFPYYRGKGYHPIKLEDHHYFSESSQFGMNIRQIKGGSIRAFQENFQSLISLIRQHLLPLLKEVKESHFYKIWFDKITENDKIVQEELKKSSPNQEIIKKARAERNEAINHMKDKWVNEVEGGRMWQMNRSATEQGLDFALLPQLFFGINLDDPFEENRTLKEQLDADVYPVDISLTAKEQVARQMYKFHTWLPTAIKDTEVTFKLKVSALKNIYAQIQMHINFMKPLLMEVSKKSEGYSKKDFFRDFDSEDPAIINMMESSYSYVRILGIKRFLRQQRKLSDLEFTKFGLFIESKDMKDGIFKGKSGYIFGHKKDDENNLKYKFIQCDRDVSNQKYKELKKTWKEKPTYINVNDLYKFPTIENEFMQTRRSQTMNTPQGPQPVPYMRNEIKYYAVAWNLYEIASYRANMKEDNLKLLETFVDELAVVRDDLIKYVGFFETNQEDEEFESITEESSKSKEIKKETSLFLGPFQGFIELLSPLIPNISRPTKSGKSKTSADVEHEHLIAEIDAIEDGWKCYSIFKKAHRFAHY